MPGRFAWWCARPGAARKRKVDAEFFADFADNSNRTAHTQTFMEKRLGTAAHLRSTASAMGWRHEKNPGLRDTVEVLQAAYNKRLSSTVVRKRRVKLTENDRDLTHKTDEKWDRSPANPPPRLPGSAVRNSRRKETKPGAPGLDFETWDGTEAE
jgi:hypothetical protein